MLCDLDVLETLPRADLVAGLAEVVKAGFIADPRILELVEADPQGATRWDGPHTRELVERAIAVKADVVGRDLTESFLREILNYGHTFGHAVEHVEGYRRRHGEAVAIGMTYAAELALRSGHLAPEVVSRHRAVLGSVGLPTAYPGGRWEDLLRAMRRDKKSRGAVLRFVVLEDVARPVRLEGPDEVLAARGVRRRHGRLTRSPGAPALVPLPGWRATCGGGGATAPPPERMDPSGEGRPRPGGTTRAEAFGRHPRSGGRRRATPLMAPVDDAAPLSRALPSCSDAG